MGFYDQERYIRGMGRTRENMANIIHNGARARVNANNAIGRAITNLSKDASGIATNIIKAKQEDEKEKSRRESLVNALYNAGASKEIIDATSNLRSSDILPMVALITNPKNIVSTHHSGGQARIQDTFTGKKENIGKTYINQSDKRQTTYIPQNDPLMRIIENNPEFRNEAMIQGELQADSNGLYKTSNMEALLERRANFFKKESDKQLESQEQRISEENKQIDSAIKNAYDNGWINSGNIDPAIELAKQQQAAQEFDDEFRKRNPYLFGNFGR